ncbi:MAG TPA: HDOD domain-containing protein [Noviherbaspirillum sp.]|nr:HDOD domain-containing protein [Noviherbaspirillum sp.]
MNTLSIPDIAARIRDLPSLPVVVVDLLDSIGKENIDTKALAEKVSHDQALTAKALRLANSSFYGMPRKVSSISQAISILGFQNVRTLIMAAGVTGNFPAADTCAFDFQGFWRHALGCAVCAKALARQLHVNQEYAFMSGLLHDIGRLVLVTFFWQQYNAALAYRKAHDCYLYEAEHEVLKIDHAMIGQALAENWKFPDALQKAVAHHHAAQAQEAGSLAAVVHIADVFSHALDLSGSDDDLVPPLSAGVWESLGIQEAAMMQVLQETEKQFAEACQILVA